jgi:DNA-binding NarL/FixJ family response regulator
MVGEAISADAAVLETTRKRVGVVLLDTSLSGRDCFDAAGAIRARCPGTSIVFMSQALPGCCLDQVLAFDPVGYVAKGDSAEHAIAAIRAVSRGHRYFSPSAHPELLVDLRAEAGAEGQDPRLSELSRREKHVLYLVGHGLSKKEIAQVLHLSERTVNVHCANMMAKLGIHDRVKLARFAIREGLVRL